MTCGFCRRHRIAQGPPGGWQTHGPLAVCPDCRRQRFRLKHITLRLAEPVCEEFRSTLENLWPGVGPLVLPDGAWQLTTIEGQRFIRVLTRDRWWIQRLHDTKWSRSRKDTFDKISIGEGRTGELRLYHEPVDECSNNRWNVCRQLCAIECRTVAWLAREPPEQFRTSTAHPARGDPVLPIQNIVGISIDRLRRAIWSNRISFPAQVPSFGNCGEPDLQRRVVQLYFLMGWGCSRIAARYQLSREQVRIVVNTWKQRAANSGYLQDIPPAETLNQLERLAMVEGACIRSNSRNWTSAAGPDHDNTLTRVSSAQSQDSCREQARLNPSYINTLKGLPVDPDNAPAPGDALQFAATVIQGDEPHLIPGFSKVQQ